ncbi:MAG: hypothetical protein JWQ74_28 [Marmoricola sp.]|nr:hypothetical protein [Marmoricola sp.]
MSTGTRYGGAVDEQVEPVEEHLVGIRRNVLLSGVVGGLAALLGVAFLLRGNSFFDVLLGLVLIVVAAVNLPSLWSARTPLLVADPHGIRLRIGLTWRGLPWSAIRQVVVEYADSPLREGRLVVVPRDPGATLGHLGLLAELNLRWNHFWYGAELSLPLGLTTLADSTDLAGDLGDLAQGRTEIVTLRGPELSQLVEVPPRTTGQPDAADGTAPAPEHLSTPTPIFDEHDDLVVPDETEHVVVQVLPEPVSPLRELNQPARVEVRLDGPTPEAEDVTERRYADDEQTVLVPVDHVIGEEATAVVAEPVIGTRIRHAREMLDMTIDELSQRTRIRPHILEAVEVDDFVPCGGDFYARGHLTSIARVLGLPLEPLMASYDELYAQAPINARRVFEAELSTGLSGGMRATLSGPRWSLLIGSVLCLTMVWGLARLFAGDPEQLTVAPDTSQSAGLAANHQPITSPLMRTSAIRVTATYAGTHLVVRDRTKKVLWSGDLAIGKDRKIVGLAPFAVTADNAGAVTVRMKGKDLGTLGTAGAKGTKSFG